MCIGPAIIIVLDLLEIKMVANAIPILWHSLANQFKLLILWAPIAYKFRSGSMGFRELKTEIEKFPSTFKL